MALSWNRPVNDMQKQFNYPHVSLVWRVINSITSIFFMLAALANVNDDDWYLWVPMYTIPCMLCFWVTIKPSVAADNKIWQALSNFILGVCIVYGFYLIYALLSTFSGSIDNPLAYEEGREMGGLLIIIAWSGISKFSSFGRGATDDSSRPTHMMFLLLWLTGTLAIAPLIIWSLCFIGDWHKHLGHCNKLFNV